MGGIAGPIQQAGQIPNQLGFGQQPGQVPQQPGQPQAGVAYNPAYAQYQNPMPLEQQQQLQAQLPPMLGVGTTYGLGGQPYPGQPIPGMFSDPMQPQYDPQVLYANPSNKVQTPYGPEQMQMMQQKMQQPIPFPRFGSNATYGNPNQGGYNPRPQMEDMKQRYQGQPQPSAPYSRTANYEGTGGMFNPNQGPMNRPQYGQQPQQRGLGGLQIDKFKSRLDQSR